MPLVFAPRTSPVEPPASRAAASDGIAFLAPREAEARRVEEADDEVEGGEEERGDGDVVVGRVRLRENDRRDRDERAGGHGRPGRQPDPSPEAGDRERGEHGERDLRRVDEEVVVHEERGPCEERLDTRRVVAAARDVVVGLDAAALHPVRDDRQVVDDRVEAERRQHDREQRAPGEREACEDDERPLPPRETAQRAHRGDAGGPRSVPRGAAAAAHEPRRRRPGDDAEQDRPALVRPQDRADADREQRGLHEDEDDGREQPVDPAPEEERVRAERATGYEADQREQEQCRAGHVALRVRVARTAPAARRRAAVSAARAASSGA